jgi:ferredoxin
MQDIFSGLRGCLCSLFWCFWWCATTLCRRVLGVWALSRGSSIGEIAARPVKFAGHETCEGCHTDILDVKKNGKHAHVNCEACHGALANHADDPDDQAGAAGYGRACARAATRRAPPSPRAFRRLCRQITRTGFPARPATIHTVRRWMQEVRSECFPASNADSIAGGGGGVEVGAGGHSGGVAELQDVRSLVGDVDRHSKCIGCGNCVRACQTRTTCRMDTSARGSSATTCRTRT